MKTVIRPLPLLSLLVMLPTVAHANGLLSQFIDPDDGYLDGSNWLLENAYGFLPVPILVTEPAVGTGGGAAMVFFHESEAEKAARKAQSRESTELAMPPSMSVAVGLATTNDTWLVAGGHIGHWQEDTIRYQGFIGKGSINLDFHGVGESASQRFIFDKGIGFNANASILLQNIKFRIGQSKWLLGAEYNFIDTENTFRIADIEISDEILNSTNAGASLIAQYQSLDNPYSPTKGFDSNWKYTFYDKAVGGDFNYTQLSAKNRYYGTIGNHFSYGARVDVNLVEGDVPFYAAPFIDMRGIPAMRYQAENILTSEVQVNYHYNERWRVIGFAGAGFAADSVSELSHAPSRVSYGVGFRYLFVKALGLTTGIDIAQGPEETVIYFKIGSTF